MTGPTAAGQIDVATLALGLARRPEGCPARAVVGSLHVEGTRPGVGLPVDDESAVLMLAAEIEGDPLGGRAGGGSPAGRGRRLDDPDWLVIGRGARRLHARRARQREILETQVGERHRAAAAGAGGDGDLDGAEITHGATPGGPPRERDLRATDTESLPGIREFENVTVPPPHVAAVGIDELDLELVGGRRAANLHVDRPRLRHPAREELAGHDEAAAALEVIVEAQRTAARAGVAVKRELRLPGGDRTPAGDVAKIVEELDGHGPS